MSVLSRTFGCVRVVWNRTLAWRHARYHGEQATTSFTQASAHLTAMKASEDPGWLNEVSSVPPQQAIRHQQVAFSNFFTGRARYPRYKSRNGRQSAEYTRSAFRYRDGRLLLAKMNTPLKFAWSWPGIDPASIEPTTVTVSRDPCRRRHVSFAVDAADPGPLPATGAVAGCQQGSANRAKAKAKVARAHRKVRASRQDFLHRTFRRMIEYKAARAGRHLIVTGRWYPSGKTCSACGHLLAELSLSTRTWRCPSCGTRHDRDINAAKNILAAGLAVSACGAGIRHSGSSRVQPAVKQEPRPATAGIPVPPGGE